jgi:hypothetical protein
LPPSENPRRLAIRQDCHGIVADLIGISQIVAL